MVHCRVNDFQPGSQINIECRGNADLLYSLFQYFEDEALQCWESLPNDPMILLSIRINTDGIYLGVK